MLDKLNQLLAYLRSIKIDPRLLLEASAERNLGKILSPNNYETGCVISANEVHRQVCGRPICFSPSTIIAYNTLLNDHSFMKVNQPLPGDIIISPTEGQRQGHIGYVLKNNIVASNDSTNGRFSTKYTLTGWNNRYVNQLGLKVAYFRKIQNA